ncbi:MAG: HEAT repeat domain-containing protein, partial [Planctomycetota bacterium]
MPSRPILWGLLGLVAAAAAQDLRYKPQERKKTHALTDPLTGETFEQPLLDPTEVAWRDRLLRPVSFGDHPRLRRVWVSPHTGFATLPDPALWKHLHEKGKEEDKRKIRRALAAFPRRYRRPDAIPALHRYRLALLTYEALGRLDENRRTGLYLAMVYCALDEGNEAVVTQYLKRLQPLVEKRADDEGLPADEMLASGYLAGEIARRLGDAQAARDHFARAASRFERWRPLAVGARQHGGRDAAHRRRQGRLRQLRIFARLGRAEVDWRDKSVEELRAILEGPDKTDAHVAALLLVDRGAAGLLQKHFSGNDLALKKNLVHRAAQHPDPALLPALRAALRDADPHVALWAARAVGEQRTPEAVRALSKELADADEELLVEGLARAAPAPAAVRELARLAQAGDPFGGGPAAARRLSLLGGPEAARALVGHVATTESYNLSVALNVALRVGPALAPPLREALERERHIFRLQNLLVLAAHVD